MRVLMVHNYYRIPGGEDEVFAAEAALLRERGHQVREFTRSNWQIREGRPWQAAATAVWSRGSARALERMARAERFAVCHFHNFFPLISPAAHRAVRRQGVAVVQTLHNYRLLCPGARLFRDGAVCQDCLGRRVPWAAVRHACYRSSRLGSAAVAAMVSVHHALGTWRQEVDCYIALSEFARRRFVEGGLPEDRIAVKPNFVHPDPGPGAGTGAFALYAGRLAPEKDVATLIRAARLLGGRLRLKIVGDGPEREPLTSLARGLEQVEFLGWLPKAQVFDLMKAAAALIVPSAWFEGPLVVLEAMAVGLPVVASRLGVLEELIDDSRTGRLFRPGDAEDLAARLERLLTAPHELAAMRREARAEFEARYGAEGNYRALERIYQLAIERNRGGR
jgi:glycosyltransferase involved in cell wall biosynthesis